MKTVLILGGTSDIAVAIAKQFGQENYEVQLAGRNRNHLQRIARDVSIRTRASVNSFYFDATDFDSHKDFYYSLVPRPDVCICVFGFLGVQSHAEKEWAESAKIIDTNYKGAISILNVVADDFEQRGQGTIIGISSVAGDRGRQSNYIYGSAKAGFTAYLSGLRNRLFEKGVHVLTVKPGFVDTKMTEELNLPQPLTAKPDEVAKSIFKAFKNKQNEIYVLGAWRYIMLGIRNVPEFVFKRLKL